MRFIKDLQRVRTTSRFEERSVRRLWALHAPPPDAEECDGVPGKLKLPER